MTSLQEMARDILARRTEGRAVWFEGSWHGWDEVGALARTVMSLVEASGAALRTPVLVITRNRPSAFAALLGLIAAGRSVRFLYPFQSAAAIAREVERLKPAVVVAAEQDFAEEVCAAIRAHAAAAVALSEMAARSLPGLERSTVPLDPEAPAQPMLEIQTSGTTGAPKRFPMSHEMALNRFVLPAAQMAKGKDGSPPPPMLLYMSMGNLSGMMSSLPALMHGMEMIVYDRFSLDGWRDYVRTYRPALSGLQPAAIQMLMDADVPREELAGLRYLTVGSAPLRPELQRAFEARYGVSVLLAYGATEFYGTVASMTPALLDQWGDAKFGSVGLPLPGMHIRTVDAESDAALPPGEEGLLQVRCEAIGPDWIRTSDLAVIDADGFLFLRGRADGAIVRGGFKLLPETIERGLLQHEAVAAAAVVGVADKRLGQVPGAAIRFKPDVEPPDAKELEAHLRQKVLATHIPVHWRFVDTMPLTPSMKIDRGAVARLFEDA